MDGVEVKSGTPATLTCKMTGLTADKPLTVTWLKGNGDPIADDAPGITYDPAKGTAGKCYSDNVRIKFRIILLPPTSYPLDVISFADLRAQRLRL